MIAAILIPSITKGEDNSPYSMYGYGLLNDNATSMQRQMGGVGIAMRSGRQINVINPAAYAGMDSLTFLWDMGADVSVLWSKDGESKERSTGGGLSYITMQFPLSRNIGASVGLLPYSSVGYAFGSKIAHGTRSNQGSGGINQAYLGVSGKLKYFSLGANIYYDFGTITHDWYATPAGGGNSLTERVMQIRDWNLTLGAQYALPLSKGNVLTFGALWQPKKSWHGKTWVTAQDISTTGDAKPDTLATMKMGGKYYQPHTFGAGISYSHSKVSHYSIEADFSWQNWKDAIFSPLTSEDGKTTYFSGMNFDNRWRIAAGGEYQPRLRGGNYFSRATYRLGGYFTRDYLLINTNNVKEYGLSCGIGLPTLEGKTMINVGFEWKHRYASPQKLVSENYFNIMIGINFNEVWFWQRKLR